MLLTLWIPWGLSVFLEQVCGHVAGIWPGFYFYLFVGISLFLFSVALDSFLTWGLVLGKWGLNCLDCD